MKRLITILVALLLVTSAPAQWSDNGDGTSSYDGSLTVSTDTTGTADTYLALMEDGAHADWYDNGDSTSSRLRSFTASTTSTGRADTLFDIVDLGGHDGWADSGTGPWYMAVPLTSPTTDDKDMMEQIRADHNYTYRTSADALDPVSWVSNALGGFPITQTGKSGDVSGLTDLLKPSFRRRWLTPATREVCEGTADNCMAQMLSVSVSSPPDP